MPESHSGPQINPIPPRARAFQGLRAGVITRSIAGGVDYALVAATTVGSYVAVAVLLFLLDPRGYQLPTWSFATFLVLGFVYLVVYLAVSFATSGRTLGDRLMGLRVVGRSGRRMRWWAALVRAAFCAAFPVGLFWCAVSRENRSLQDIVLRTSVIHEWPVLHGAPTLLDAERRRADG